MFLNCWFYTAQKPLDKLLSWDLMSHLGNACASVHVQSEIHNVTFSVADHQYF